MERLGNKWKRVETTSKRSVERVNIYSTIADARGCFERTEAMSFSSLIGLLSEKGTVAKLKVVLVVPSTTKIFQVNFCLPCQFYK